MNAAAPWWNEFFKGPFAELQIKSQHVDSTERDVNRVMAVLGEAPATILDAPCGAGRHSLEFARRGKRVVGIDFNPAVLDVAKKIASDEGLDADFRLQDLRQLDFDAEFDAVTCLWTSVGYFDDEDNERVFQGLGRAVRPGGALFIDTQCAETLFPIHRQRHWDWWGEAQKRKRVLQETNWDYRTGRVEAIWHFELDGRWESRAMSLRVYTCRELIEALVRAGFDQFHALGPGDEEFRIGSPRLWLRAQKPS